MEQNKKTQAELEAHFAALAAPPNPDDVLRRLQEAARRTLAATSRRVGYGPAPDRTG